MIKTYLFDLAKVILFPVDQSYAGELNAKYAVVKSVAGFQFGTYFSFDQGMVDFLHSLKGSVRLCMYTSGQIQKAPEVASILQDIFEIILSAEDLGISKKDPQGYQVVMAKLGQPADEVVFIDDTEANIIAARQAGLHAIQYTSLSDLQEQLQDLP